MQNLDGPLANNCGWLKVGIECEHGAIEIQQGLSDHRELRRKTKPAVGGNSGYLQDNLAGVEPGEICIRILGDKFGDPFAKFSLIKTSLRFAHANGDFCRLFAASLGDSQQKAQHVVAEAGQEARNHSQIQQPNLLVVSKKDIARVWIGVHKTVEQYLLEISAKQLASEAGPVYFH